MIKKTGKLSLVLASTLLAAVTTQSLASSHREAPYISKYPQVDGTDFYLFNSYEPGRENYATILANYIPVQAAYGGPNYFPLGENALYEIHLDNDGGALKDITFQFQFHNHLPENGVVSFEIGEGDNKKTIPAVLKNVGGISADSAGGLNYLEDYTVTIVHGDRRTGTATPLTHVNSEQTAFPLCQASCRA